MMASVATATPWGAAGRHVVVEAHVSNGVPGFTVVGLPDAACREARDRVRAALLSSGLTWPLRRITVNLAPSGVRKGGAGLDLAIALATLVADGQTDGRALEGRLVLGELGLDGSIRPVRGVVPLAAVGGAGGCVVAQSDARAARVATAGPVHGFATLGDLVEACEGRAAWPSAQDEIAATDRPPGPDLADVAGQPLARLAMEVCAASGCHLLLVGPPGAGKTMLARRLPGLLPSLSASEAVEVTMVHSAAGEALPPDGLVTSRPFRSPHHTITAPALVGGGSSTLRPGEVSLAHRGVLFLDELGEFRSGVLDALRQPMESGTIRVARAHGAADLPAGFLLVAAANPCPCGQGGPSRPCRCSEAAVDRYRRRLSGPLRDRFACQVWMEPPGLPAPEAGVEPTSLVADRVAAARVIARDRSGALVGEVPDTELERLVPLVGSTRRLLEAAVNAGELSARGVASVRRIALTLADLGGRGSPGSEDLALAMLLRGVESRVGTAA